MQGRTPSAHVPSVRRSKDGLQIPTSGALEVLPPEPALHLPRIFAASQPGVSASSLLYRDGRPFSANSSSPMGNSQLPTAHGSNCRPLDGAISQVPDATRPLSVDTGRSALRRRQDAAGRPPLDSSLLPLSSAGRSPALRIPVAQRSPRPPLPPACFDEDLRARPRPPERRFGESLRTAERERYTVACLTTGSDDACGESTFFLTDVGIAAAEPVCARNYSPSPPASPMEPSIRQATPCLLLACPYHNLHLGASGMPQLGGICVTSLPRVPHQNAVSAASIDTSSCIHQSHPLLLTRHRERGKTDCGATSETGVEFTRPVSRNLPPFPPS